RLAGRRHPRRGRLLAHRRDAGRHPHLLPLLTAGHRPHPPRRPRGVPHRPAVVHRLLPAGGGRVTPGAPSPAGSVLRLDDVAMYEVRLTTPVAPEAIARLKLGDVVYIDGAVYTAREGVYRKVVEEGRGLPPSV